MSEDILYEVKERTAVITLNLPKAFNALTLEGYYKLNQLMEKAAEEKDTIATLIQSTGKFFSAGANVKGGLSFPEIPDGASAEDEKAIKKRHFQETFAIRNLVLTETFRKHPKVLVVALNGPVIGLSSALVALADFIYALDTVYLLTPFANLGLVGEGAASYTLVQRLGLSKANEALLASRPIKAQDLVARGFINEMYPASKFPSTEAFNQHIQDHIKYQFYELVPESVRDIKKIIRSQTDSAITDVNYYEVWGGVDKFTAGLPMKRFAAIAAKERRHKL